MLVAMQPPAGSRRVLVVSAGMGTGHHAAADELVRRLRELGHLADRVDVLALGRPGQGRRLRRTYAFLLRRLPWLYDAAMRLWARWPAPLERLTARGAAGFEEGLLETVAGFRPDVVVSVYNLASQALGRLRADGRLDLPVATYVTDPGAHPYWVHPAVDLHLAVLPATAEALRTWGARRTACVAPLVGPRFTAALPLRAEARDRFDLPADGAVALVTGGSWAAGDLAATVAAVAGTGRALPVVLCGADDGLRRSLEGRGTAVALGWTDDVPALMAAADVLVDNAGGLTCWEALSCGLPVVLFRPLPGHGRLNAEALESAGLAGYARAGCELAGLLQRACAPGRPAPRPLGTGDPVQQVLGLAAAARRSA
jgi:UDP-N-acetylglucosamine:LPS N-acetylglucosamine transferase